MASPKHPRLSDPANTLYLIDISSFIFRAFYAIRSLTNSKGEPTNAIYGVATMLARLAEEAKPEYLGVIYDSKEPSLRKEIYAEYKANRADVPELLIPQFDLIEELIECFEIRSYRKSGIEADDLIATAARKWCASSPKHQVVIVSSDKDLMQLVDDRTCLWDTMSQKIYTQPEVEEKFGVRPDQIRDYLALVGDSSDNIPGVESIGPKSAVDLLKAYDTLDGVLAAAAAGKISGKKGEVLKSSVEVARLSAKLATVDENLKIDFDPASFRYRFHVSDACQAFLKRMDFHSLITKWAGAASGPVAKESAPQAAAAPVATAVASSPVTGQADDSGRFRTINTEKAFIDLLNALEKTKEFGFDVETTSLNPRAAELVGVAICYDPEFAFYIPVGHRGMSVEQLPLARVIEGLRPYLENPKYKKIGQNLKYDWSVLGEMGLKPDGIGADTMIASYVLDAGGRHNLEPLCAQYLGYGVMTYEQVCGKGKDQIGFDQVDIATATRYSAEDAWVAYKLWHVLKPKLEEEKLMEVFATIDLPLVPVLSQIERNGVCVDVEWLKSLSKDFEKRLASIEERVGAYANGPINLNSTKQLAQLLFEQLGLPPQSKTKTGYSTDASVLEALAPLHEVPRMLLEYREISKLKGTYVDPLPEMRDPKTGKIHAGFHQTVAATGRLSSSDPNLQNIPIRTERGRKIRRAFIPSPGNVLVSADYSQIELRLLAHMSGDKELVRSFKADEDVHRRTAAEIFDVDPEKVDDRQRGIAKAINFGLMYGKSAFGLAQELGIGRREAQDTIDRYFKRYNGVKRYLDQLIIDAREKGYAVTLFGRKRKLPDLHSKNPAMRGMAERMAMNTPIQGTAADLMKIAMTEIANELESKGYKSKLIIQVHDEVVLDCPRDEAKDVIALVTRVMEGSAKLDVPLRVNAGMGENWEEL